MDKSEVALALDRQSTGAPEWDGWKTNVDIKIQVPLCKKCSEGTEKTFTVPDLAYRPLVSVIRAAFTDPVSQWFHLTPFKHIWKSPVTGREQRLYDELYTSDAWNKAHNDLQKQQREDSLERVIAGLMFWSDGTHLAQFGHATAWPVYLFFGNLSKYKCASASSGLCHPVAFIPSVSLCPVDKHTDLLTHCKHELFHAVWKIILDDEFVKAYKNGIVIKCHDGVLRHVFPWIFTYSADYPEKVLIATICDKGLYPCPRCLLPKSSFHRLGSLSDLKRQLSYARTYLREMVCAARHKIYELGNPIKGTNAFAERLTPFGFNIYPVLVMDLMHSFTTGNLSFIAHFSTRNICIATVLILPPPSLPSWWSSSMLT
ncbi:hypothetical protein SCLCIDRAFT_123103 [Scleroderma citrinum Foug A]|uniref:Uncharacterized protein n=1 Tax=Scleroderma citrinum Foug A TaxID=1036808 RepID=A0A0C3A7Z5_9AGAM|nr:hypothetical protein SCLCIDRAFT_123103 [Scleroderma citrinum Foug A]